ncbi:PREDICTED: uncharacterized protein LOC105578219 [Cercocebus atys]|uniref:uncharacterized protein LOC105578219 n=1 Tax=Cercocebus atys TaxID=9531 RepID=UPI0005F3D8D9|nr:PREDICTED: uncharacterized protein LOC105578219 [Cercocebus atys]
MSGRQGTGFSWVRGRLRQGYLAGVGVGVGAACTLSKLGPSGSIPECGWDRTRAQAPSRRFSGVLGFSSAWSGKSPVAPGAHGWTSRTVWPSSATASKTDAHSICSRGMSVPRVVTLDPSRTCLWLSLPMSPEAASGCRSPRDLEIKGGRSSTKEGGQRMAHGSVHFQATARLAALGISLCPSETLPASLHCNPIPDDPVGSIIRWREKSAQPRRHPEAPPAPGTEAEDRSRRSARQDYYGSDPGSPAGPSRSPFPTLRLGLRRYRRRNRRHRHGHGHRRLSPRSRRVAAIF